MQAEIRRGLGAFYTPPDLAALVASWAIDRPNMRILEPSVGSGALVDAALNRFKAVGDSKIVGFELDVATVALLGRYSADKRIEIRQSDFFDIDATANFDLVLANPPFTRNHRLTAETRKALKGRVDASRVARGAAGLWIYFLLASLPHLRRGGCLAFVVPGAVEFADYAKPVLAHICSVFTGIELIAIDSDISWEGKAQERAMVLLATGFGEGSSEEIRRWRTTTDGSVPMARQLVASLPTANHRLLGDLARVEIGSVTGANDIFLADKDGFEHASISESDLTLTVARARHACGIKVGAGELRSLASRHERTLLLTPAELGDRGGPVRRYLAKISPSRRKSTIWLNKRSPWWKVQIGAPFDGVLTYMNHAGPKIALVDPGVAATNTLHKVTFISRDPDHHRAVCVSLLTTYCQLHAEVIGRVYGGGVLKFELKDARRLPVLLPSIQMSPAVFARIDTALKAGAFDIARQLADAAILPEFFGDGWKEAQIAMTVALIKTRSLRARTRPKSKGELDA